MAMFNTCLDLPAGLLIHFPYLQGVVPKCISGHGLCFSSPVGVGSTALVGVREHAL